MEDAFEILVHLVVPETQDPIALAGEVIVPLRVALGVHLKIVLTTVDLDDEPMLEAQEIQDVAVERCLAAEVISLRSPRAKMDPELHLLRRHLLAQAARDLVGHEPHPARFRATLPCGEGSASAPRPHAHYQQLRTRKMSGRPT